MNAKNFNLFLRFEHTIRVAFKYVSCGLHIFSLVLGKHFWDAHYVFLCFRKNN